MRAHSALILLALAVGLTGCGKKDSNGPPESQGITPSGAQQEEKARIHEARRAEGTLQPEEDAIKGLSSQDDYVRMHSALSLGKLKSSRAVRPLVTALESDSKMTVRGPAAWALGEIRDKQAIGPLITALGDKDEMVKASAAAALVNFGDDAVRMILRVLPTIKDDQAKLTIIRIIKDIGEDAIGPLVDELGMGQEDPTRTESGIFAALFLAEMGKEAVVPLITVLESDTTNATAKYNAMYCLSKINDRRAVEPIRGMLKSTDTKLRDCAAKALQQMGATTTDR